MVEFIWALFFVGAGGYQPIDTGLRFDSHSLCSKYGIQSAALAEVDHMDRLFLPDHHPTDAYYDLSEEDKDRINERVVAIQKKYECIPFK